uniref:SMP-30/Gluconolactonase/LRE-like region domain-containing protein n=1 Tax=Bionectria ochroleuca TaxID=29856 RepID=A0A8H7K966_BIOOC
MWSALGLTTALLSLSSLVVSEVKPTLLTQLPQDWRIENIAILPNSTLIIPNSYTGELFGINTLHGASGATPYFVTSLAPYSSAIFGLASPTSDTIAATANNFIWNTGQVVNGTNAVHLITLTKSGPKAEIFPFPSAGWLNGLTPVPGAPHYLLIADCHAGSLLRLDTRTGSIGTVSTDPLFATVPSPTLSIGINGVHALDGFVYFTNTDQRLYGRLAIDNEGLAVGKPAEVITTGINGSTFDDFALRSDHTGFLATGMGINGIEKVTERGKTEIVASWEYGSSEISQASSGVFGQTARDRGTLYFATAGSYLGSDIPATGAQVFTLKKGC